MSNEQQISPLNTLIAAAILGIFVLVASAAHGQQTPAAVLDATPVDGVDLTSAEVEEYNRSVEARATALRNTKAFVENVVSWIDNTAPAVVQDQAEADRITAMRADFIALGKRVITALAEQDVTGVQVRERTMTRDLEAKEFEVVRLQEATEPDQAAIDAATAERNVAAAALETFRTANPPRER